MSTKNKDSTSIVLILGPEWLADIKNPNLKTFSSFTMLLDYLFQNNEDDETRFRLVVPNACLHNIIDMNIADLEKVDAIDIFYHTAQDLNQVLKDHKQTNQKITLHLTPDVNDHLVSQIKTTDHSSSATAKPKRPRRKKKSKKNKWNTSVTMNADILCHRCSVVINDPFQLPCGHRQCKICIDQQDRNLIKCIECHETALRDEVWADRGYQREIEKLKSMTIFSET